jgi:hypothetical protein
MEFGSVTLKINNQHTLQGIDPQTKGKPAYASYIGAKVAQRFETDWGVVVVCFVTADPHRKSMTRTPASDAIYPAKNQLSSIIWQDNTDSVVDLRRLMQYVKNFGVLHQPSTSIVIYKTWCLNILVRALN